MAFKDILKVFKLERELTDGETALLNTLRGMSESERELLAETLGPTVKAKAKPTATKRKYERCEVCNLTRRADTHTDKDAGGYHEFVQSESAAKKSARASGIAATLGSRSRKPQPATCVQCGEARAHENHNVETGHEFTTDLAERVNEVLDKHNEDNDDKCWQCKRGVDENIHQLTTAQGYHEFIPTIAQAASGG